MPLKLVVAVTDRDWFEHLRSRPHLSEVNFWSPGATPFRALEAGELFFFKLHAPANYIAGFWRLRPCEHVAVLGSMGGIWSGKWRDYIARDARANCTLSPYE